MPWEGCSPGESWGCHEKAAAQDSTGDAMGRLLQPGRELGMPWEGCSPGESVGDAMPCVTLLQDNSSGLERSFLCRDESWRKSQKQKLNQRKTKLSTLRVLEIMGDFF